MKRHKGDNLNFGVLSGIGFIMLLMLASSCEKVIDLKLDTSESKYTIEANMSDQSGDCQVLLSRTIPVEENNMFPVVEHALVTITEDGGNPVKLTEVLPGRYISWDINAKEGKSYKLEVKTDGHTFSAVCKVPYQVIFDSLYIGNFEGFGDIRRFPYVMFQDPPLTSNWYRFLLYKNGIQNSNIFILSDQYSNGRPINTFLAFFDQSDVQRIDVGDTVSVEVGS